MTEHQSNGKKEIAQTQTTGHWVVLVKGITYVLAGVVLSIRGSDTFYRFPGSLNELFSNTSVVFSWAFASALIGTALILFGSFDLIYKLAWLLTSKVTIKKNRIEWRTGLIHHQIEPISYTRIESVALYRSLLGRMLNYGTLRIYGVGSGMITIPNIRKAKSLASFINKRKDMLCQQAKEHA